MARPRTVDDDAILAAAARAVAAVGPTRLTLADVGREVGLSPSTLVQRFGSKRGLLLALAAHDAEAVPERVRAARSADDPLRALVDVLAELAEGVGDAAEFANHLAFLLVDLSDPEFRVVTRRHADALRRAVRQVLAAGRSAGQLPDDADLTELAALVHTTYNGALVTWGMSPSGSAGAFVRARLTALVAALTR